MEKRFEVIYIINGECDISNISNSIRILEDSCLARNIMVVFNGGYCDNGLHIPKSFRIRRIAEKITYGEIINDYMEALGTEDVWLIVLTEEAVMDVGYIEKAVGCARRTEWEDVLAIVPQVVCEDKAVSPMVYDFVKGVCKSKMWFVPNYEGDIRQLCTYGKIFIPFADICGMVVYVANALKIGGFPMHYEGECLAPAIGRLAYSENLRIEQMPAMLNVMKSNGQAEDILTQTRIFYREEANFRDKVLTVYARITKLAIFPLKEGESRRNSINAYRNMKAYMSKERFLSNYRSALRGMLWRAVLGRKGGAGNIWKELLDTYRGKWKLNLT